MTPEGEIYDPNVNSVRLVRYASPGSAVVGGVLGTAGLIGYLVGAGDWYWLLTALGLLIGLGRNVALRRI